MFIVGLIVGVIVGAIGLILWALMTVSAEESEKEREDHDQFTTNQKR